MSIDKVAKALETPAYVAVGFGVLGFQRAQVRRRELQRHMAGAANTLNQRLGEVAERLPREARDLLKAAGEVAQDLPHEAEEAAKEVVALGRLVLGTVRGSGGRRPFR